MEQHLRPRRGGSVTVLAPHPDDEALFTAYTLLRHRPKVAVVLSCPPVEERAAESRQACELLGVEVEQWEHDEAGPDWTAVGGQIRRLKGRVWAPWPELDGHEHHNAVGILVEELIPRARVTYYTTYTPKGRTQGDPVETEPGWPDLKLRALGCYTTQRSRIAAHLERGLDEYEVTP